jgi:hypothetical protein
VTVHDDVPDGIFGRSVRYRSLASFVRPVFYGALQRARSVDVISDGMCRYYRFLLGRAPIVVRPYLPASPPPAPERPATADELVVGHIGTIYDISEWRAFLGALRERARLVHRTPRMRVIGLDAKFRSLLGAEQEMVEDLGGLPEAEARRRLGECHFLYAMYPFAPTAEVFRRTSIPTKLTTYLCCELPIFAHTPLPSSLGEVVRRYDVGVVCAAPAGDALAEGIAAIIGRRPEPGAFARARAELYGRDNVDRLSAALAALTA